MTAQIGTISEGTTRPEDLIPAFADTLEQLEGDNSLIDEARGLMEDYDGQNPEYIRGILDGLMDALEEHTPPFCYFGTLEGDAADYGFWPDADAVNNEIKIQGVPLWCLGVGYTFLPENGIIVHISDHGDISLYEVGLGSEIWSVV